MNTHVRPLYLSGSGPTKPKKTGGTYAVEQHKKSNKKRFRGKGFKTVGFG
jgi:hypothetical protein